VRTASHELIALFDDLERGDHQGLQLRFMRFVNPAPQSKRETSAKPQASYTAVLQLLAGVTDSWHFMYSVVFAYAILPTKPRVHWFADRRVRQISIDLFGNTDSGMHVIIGGPYFEPPQGSSNPLPGIVLGYVNERAKSNEVLTNERPVCYGRNEGRHSAWGRRPSSTEYGRYRAAYDPDLGRQSWLPRLLHLACL
jgi:hypothetical protein